MRGRAAWIGCLVLAGCAEGVVPDGGGAGYDREVRGGRLHDLSVSGVDDPAVELSALVASAPPLRDELGAIDDDDFAITSRSTATAGAPLTTVFAQQTIGGIPVRGAYLYLATQRGARGDRLLASSYHLYQGAAVGVVPSVARDRAITAGRTHLRVAADAEAQAALAIWSLDGRLTLVWEVVAEGGVGQALVIAAGPEAGRVEVRDDRVYDTAGSVSAWVAVGGAPGGAGTPIALPLPVTKLSAGGARAITGDDGHYQLAAPAGSTVTATLDGAAARVFDTAAISASGPAAPMLDLVLGTGTGEAALAQATAYYYTTRAWQFLDDNGIPAASLGAPLRVNTNLADTCNAYFMPSARTINFFRSGGGCRNSAEASIVAHEYGHFVDHTFGGITESGLSEGWGDVVACLMMQAPIVGGDLLPGGDIIRSCANSYLYPPGGNDEAHALGQAWAGFVWHAREGLIAAEGEAAGDARIRALVLPSLPSNAPTIPDAVREVFLRDDDDGDLSNHTPHWDVLLAAANRHGLGFIVDQDLSPPAAVTDLAITAATTTSVTLRWTAPGDDGTTGTAASYELRWSSAPLTPATFAAATAVAAPLPQAAGTVHEATIAVPPTGTIYLALRASDELGNTGELSNVASIALPPATVIFDDGAEAGIGAWQATGLWHVTTTRAADGTAAFWYGNEATGTYDTGGANQGELLSPIIDLTGVAHPRLTYAEWLEVESGQAYDQLAVQVFDADQPSVLIARSKTTGTTHGAFVDRMLELDGLAGRRVRIRFQFTTVDGAANAMAGWFVDRVRVFGDGAASPAGGLLVNEVLADPPGDLDANGDGAFSIRGDELIELVNTGGQPLDLGGATVADSLAVRVTLADGTVLAPGQALVVFGGSAPSIPGVLTVATDGLYLNNSGDAVVVRGRDGATLAELAWGSEGGRDQSLVRQVDGAADSPIVGHRSVAATPASPGRRSDGSAWGSAPPVPVGRLLINEVLADPPAGYDAGGDGVASVTADEFVELVNVGTAALDLGGATLSDATAVRGTFAAGTTLAPGAALVVFGGGAPMLAGCATAVFAPLQLNNGGDAVTVRAADGTVLAEMAYDTVGGMDQALVRATDGDAGAAFVLHGTLATTPASPGRRTSGQPW